MARAACLPEKRFRRSLLTMLLSFALLVLYYTHWSPRAIARLLGVRGRAPAQHHGRASYARLASGGVGGSEASLVWVLLGDTHYQPYLMESIRQARVFNPRELFFLVIEPRFWPSNHSWYEPLRQYNVRAQARRGRGAACSSGDGSPLARGAPTPFTRLPPPLPPLPPCPRSSWSTTPPCPAAGAAWRTPSRTTFPRTTSGCGTSWGACWAP